MEAPYAKVFKPHFTRTWELGGKRNGNPKIGQVDWMVTIWAVGIMLCAAIVAVIVPPQYLPSLAIVSPIAYFLAVLGDIGTAFVLLADRGSHNRAYVALSMSFFVSGTLTLCAMLTLPLLPAEPPLIASAGSQTGIWFYTLWHVFAAFGGLWYVVLSRRADVSATPRFTIIAAVIGAAGVAAAIAIAVLIAPYLPALAGGRSLAGLQTSGIGPATLILLAVATAGAFSIRDRTPFGRAYALSLLALTLDVSVFVFSPHRYTVGFYISRILLLYAAFVILTRALRILLASQVRLRETATALHGTRHESATRAGRIRALWSIASGEARPADEHSLSILQAAVMYIRPEKPIFGILSHLEDDEIVVDATAWNSIESVGAVGDVVYSQARLPLAGSLEELLLSDPEQRAFDDFSLVSSDRFKNSIGWKSAVGTVSVVGRKMFFLIFASTEAMIAEPFDIEDVAYVDVVAAIFANRAAQIAQFERIQFQIEHDALTGLANRTQFRKQVRAAIQAAEPFGVASVNVDKFQQINERYGYQIGDELLVEIGSELRRLSEENSVARLGSDEFGLLLPVATGKLESALAPYQSRFSLPFNTGDREGLRVVLATASIGGAEFPAGGNTVDDLLRRASVALDIAKRSGGATTTVFEPQMEAILEQRTLRYREFAEAIAAQQLVLDYQATFDLATGNLAGAEALVRWDHPVRGRLAPGEFIDFAERSGLIHAMTRWVVERVIFDLTSCVLPAGFRCYVNLAPPLLEDVPFVTYLSERMRAHPDLSDHLGFEVTEAAAMRNVERSVNTLAMLRSLGATIAIDDFGTGYSSLAYLRELTVDIIKIDHSFVSTLPGEPRDSLLCAAMIDLANAFGFRTLAEGVETASQAAWLSGHGCEFGQGFLLARPLPFADLAARFQVEA